MSLKGLFLYKKCRGDEDDDLKNRSFGSLVKPNSILTI